MRSSYELEILLNYTVGERRAEAQRERLVLEARPPRAASVGTLLVAFVTSVVQVMPSAYLRRLVCQHSV